MDTKRWLSRIYERIEEIVREIGVLLLAFTPLDAAFGSDRPDRDSLVLRFFCSGLALVMAALIAEAWRTRE